MIELRINNQLCDLPDNFSVTLKRVFYDPTQLITKDAQSSYSISLPATDTNKRIFDFKNIQESKNKFGRLYTASLVVDSQSIFEGDFRLDEITPDLFKGNLVIIFKYSLTDILGDKYMNQCGEWPIKFEDFNESVEKYNTESNSECIFPYVMYGLPPKKANAEGVYSSKNNSDNSVSFSALGGFPPSINCIQMLQKIFPYFGLNLGGTALGDARLKNLYMSYKNPSEYEMEWNWGYNAVIELEGKWSNYQNFNKNTNYFWAAEATISVNGSPKLKGTHTNGTPAIYNTDLLSNVNGTVDITIDNGGNVDVRNIKNNPTTNIPEYTSRKIRIPHSGYYKVRFEAEYEYNLTENWNKRIDAYFGNKNIMILGAYPGGQPIIKRRRFEMKVVRDRNTGSFDFDEMDIDMAFYENAIFQTPTFKKETEKETEDDDDKEKVPEVKYYPKGGEMCFIDPAQTKKLVCGIGFGRGYENQINHYTAQSSENETVKYTHPIAAKGGYSYDGTDSDFQYIASRSTGYMECRLNEEDLVKGVISKKYEQSNKFKVDMIGAESKSEAEKDLNKGGGEVYTIVWFDKGELITVVHSADMDRNGPRHGVPMQDVSFKLSIEPFKKEKSWLTNQLTVNGDETTTPIKYNEDTDFLTKKIDLIKFLPSNIKINEWITQFCNAFNLSLIQLDDTHYELNTNKRLASYGTNYIDISKKLYQGYNPTYKPLDIPYIYDIGFTINEEEQGYNKDKNKDNQTFEKGGGKVQTWKTDGKTLTQNSTFSYCWYQDIKFDTTTKKGVCKIPVISDKEPFALDDPRDYAEMQQKDYYDLAQRFWYKGDNIVVPKVNNKDLTVSLVKGALDGEMTLDYHDEPLSILRNYFTVITGSETSYTSVSCYLEQWEYNRLSSSFVIFNNDIFFVSAVDSYNPITKIAQLKLIRKSIL